MKKKIRIVVKIKYILILLTIFMLSFVIYSYTKGDGIGTIKSAALYIVSPVRNAYSSIIKRREERKERGATAQELQAQIDALKAENEALKLKVEYYRADEYELDELRTLMELKDKYAEYDMTGATVIAKSSDGWISEFTIDKGSRDGIKVDMNVLAGSGLCGIVTQVSENSSVVSTIIEDDMNVSAVSSATRDMCIVSGDLELMSEGYIRIMHISIDAKMAEYERIITSSTSSKYLPGILIGYACDITDDPNGLTRSGHLIPAVDFAHMENVLVITRTKKDIYR